MTRNIYVFGSYSNHWMPKEGKEMLTLLADSLMIATRQTPYGNEYDQNRRDEVHAQNARRVWSWITRVQR